MKYYDVPLKHVYIIQKPDGAIKIGISQQPEIRISNLEHSGCFKTERKYVSKPCSNANVIENELHKLYKEGRIHGEWFMVDFDDCVKSLEQCIERMANFEVQKKPMIELEDIDMLFDENAEMTKIIPSPKIETMDKTKDLLSNIKIWNDKRVVTFKDIDIVHDRPDGTSRAAFNRNKKRFIANEDYFVCQTYEAKEKFGISAPKGLILLTEMGYLMIVKAFNDDKSWEVQRTLVNSYFRAKDLVAEGSSLELEDEKKYLAKYNRTWYDKEKWKMDKLCYDYGWDRKYMYHKILKELGDIYNLECLREMFYNRVGREAKYDMELVNHFPTLQLIATRYLDFLLDA